MEEKVVFNTDKNTHSIHLRRKISHLQFYRKLIAKRYVLQLVVCLTFLLNSEMKNAIYHRLINQSLVSVSYLRGSHLRYDINTNAIEQCVWVIVVYFIILSMATIFIKQNLKLSNSKFYDDSIQENCYIQRIYCRRYLFAIDVSITKTNTTQNRKIDFISILFICKMSEKNKT